MHRKIVQGIGVLEILVAGALVAVGGQLPSSDSVGQNFDRVGQATTTAEKQVQLMRNQVDEVRKKDFPKFARQLKIQTDAASKNLQYSTIDFTTVEAICQALGAAANGLQTWSDTLEPDQYAPVAKLLESISEALVRQDLDRQKSARYDLRQLIPGPHDENNGHFFDEYLSEPNRFAAHRPALDRCAYDERLLGVQKNLIEFEAALESSIVQIELVGAANYPVLSPSGIASRPIWPEGARTAVSLRQLLNEAKAIHREVDKVALVMPAVLGTFEDALREPRQLHLNRTVPTGARDIGAEIRQAHQRLESTMRTWPELVHSMRHSAIVLQNSQKQLETVLAQRTQYEQALDNRHEIVHAADELLGSSTATFDTCLSEQEKSLGQMKDGLHEVSSAIPSVKRATTDLVTALRWMFSLVGALIGLHGLLTVVSVRWSVVS